jgi:probable phosphoglycerate mutase
MYSVAKNLVENELNEIIAYVDGGARGNPGPSGCGAIIKDSSGNTIKTISEFLGYGTNNVAEYTGVIKVLEYLMKNKPTTLTLYTDSNLVVQQLNGKFKVKDIKIKPLHKYCLDMLSKIPHYEIIHVKREKNKEADRLANLAMDKGDTKFYDSAG